MSRVDSGCGKCRQRWRGGHTYSRCWRWHQTQAQLRRAQRSQSPERREALCRPSALSAAVTTPGKASCSRGRFSAQQAHPDWPPGCAQTGLDLCLLLPNFPGGPPQVNPPYSTGPVRPHGGRFSGQTTNRVKAAGLIDVDVDTIYNFLLVDFLVTRPGQNLCRPPRTQIMGCQLGPAVAGEHAFVVEAAHAAYRLRRLEVVQTPDVKAN